MVFHEVLWVLVVEFWGLSGGSSLELLQMEARKSWSKPYARNQNESPGERLQRDVDIFHKHKHNEIDTFETSDNCTPFWQDPHYGGFLLVIGPHRCRFLNVGFDNWKLFHGVSATALSTNLACLNSQNFAINWREPHLTSEEVASPESHPSHHLSSLQY